MDTSKLKKFAQYARRSLIEQVESKFKLVLAEESEARREYPKAVAELEKKLAEKGAAGNAEQQLIEQVAYTWFNRFCALRFMDVNQYNRIMVISPLAGQFQPEVLAEAKAGHIDEGIVNEAVREKVFGLLSGSIASRDGQSEAFRLLIVAVCNDLHRIMPYLFERIEDYTELLMPDDLLSGNSILAYTREAMTPEACESVESIGWLYQFYISEKKDEVFNGLKKNKKITPENIPAATQLFTPHWIVRYLVENSLGRLWMLNNPSSKVIEQMDYYIKPGEEEKDFLQISSPEEIKICDPACGSGHMLTYAYDLLYAIYSSTGDYDDAAIPGLILNNNLYGIEIDERAAELAAFALTMKAIKGDPSGEGSNRRRFFRNPVEPNICRLERVVFTDEELDGYIDFAGKDLFTQDLRATLKEFEEADNFGSLIQPTLKAPADALAALDAKDVSGQLFFSETHKSVLKVLGQAEYLSQKYHVVVANPPYMGGKGMNPRLVKWLKDGYSESKTDLFAAFIERCMALAQSSGLVSMITMQSWMFLSSFEKVRVKLMKRNTIVNMAHLGTRAFDSIGGEVVSTTAFVLMNKYLDGYEGSYSRLTAGKSESEKMSIFSSIVRGEDTANLFHSSAKQFRKIPGWPVTYWLSDSTFDLFTDCKLLAERSRPKVGLNTTDNNQFLRHWFEVSQNEFGLGVANRQDAIDSKKQWFPYNKGGGFRKWYGNQDYVLNWRNDGEDIKTAIANDPAKQAGGRVVNEDCYFKSSISWSLAGAKTFSIRVSPPGFVFDVGGSSIFPSDEDMLPLSCFLMSSVANYLMGAMNPTFNFQAGNVAALPIKEVDDKARLSEVASSLISIYKKDWDSLETSWAFTLPPMLELKYGMVSEAVSNCLNKSGVLVEQALELEEKNNKYFMNLYGLSDELDSKPVQSEITLHCNPFYKYGPEKPEPELLAMQKAELVGQFVSYTVGCMFGRYSLDKEGLILANQGDTLEDYLKQVSRPSFMPDDDNVIPLIDFDGDWFEDDITERFKQFLKVTFGEENFAENVAFIEEAIGKDIKKFFLKDFYTDHVKRYKKRPIYWMFSSPKGSFNALIYMHRYRPDTVSVVLNDYLREFRTKLQARKESYEQIEVSATAGKKEKTQAIKAIRDINKVLSEINDYEHDTLYPLAGKPPEIDLDDGVKHNYPLFGKALKKVPGLS